MLRDYLRDQLKFDVDYLRNVVSIKEGDVLTSTTKLQAFKRATDVADPKIRAYELAFKKHMKILRIIAKRAQSSCIVRACLAITQSEIFS